MPKALARSGSRWGVSAAGVALSRGRSTGWALAALALLLAGSGCVPYQRYKVAVDELERAKEQNQDLVKKYNQAILELRQNRSGDSGSQYAAELAELRQRNSELAEQLSKRGPSLAFEKADIPAGAGDDRGGISLGDALLFPEGSDKLRPESFGVLDEIVRLLKNKYPSDMVIIEGHTDTKPLKNVLREFDTNLMLGARRAYAVFKYFRDHDIPESRVKLESYSYNRPVNEETKNTDEGRKKNRRVVVRRAGLSI